MTNRQVARLKVAALIVPATLGLACGLKRDWSVCTPTDPCLAGYVCTATWQCVRAPDGGASDGGGVVADAGVGLDGAPRVESGGDTSGSLSMDVASPDVPSVVTADGPAVGISPDVPAGSVSPDAPVGSVPPDAPVVSIAPDAPVVSIAPDAPAADVVVGVPSADALGTCSTDKDCSPTAPLCLGSRCAKCSSDDDCRGRSGTPACATGGMCVACTQNKHCAAGTTASLCDTTANQCVGCLQRSDCAGACQICTKGACAAAPASTVCRAAINSCDQAENCTGNSPDCPADGFKDSSTVCADANCDGNQYALSAHCAGTSATCTPAAKPTNCNAYACTLTGCKTSCTGPADCASPSVCNPDLSACGGPYYTAVSAGSQTTCAVVSDGTARCWGRNDSGELGMGQVANQVSPPDPTVFQVVSLSDAVLIGANSARSCAVLSDKSVSCWGWGRQGLLGDGSSTMRPSPGPVPGLSNVTGISLGSTQTCVVAVAPVGASTVSCWGINDQGQVGADPDVAPEEDTPYAIVGFTAALQVSAGGSHTCMVLKTGQIYCWGANDAGQLGDQTTDGRYSPRQVSGITDAASVASGYDFTCALLKTGTVQCWGHLPGFASVVTSPTTVAGLGNAGALSANFMVCGLMADGTVSCWEPSASAPTKVGGIADVKAVSVGGDHTCVLERGGVVKCWGGNMYGQLGDETTTDSDTPVTAKGP